MWLSGWMAMLIVGAIAGWIAGNLMKGGGFGLVGNIAVGIIGSFVGNAVFRALNMHAGGFLGSLITAVVGAVLLLGVVAVFKK